MKKISVIVPIYNVKDYLEKCVSSLLHQDLDEYEIILVNDGSTDGSKIIADELENKYPSKIRVFHKENGGLSDARNYGLQYSTSEYLLFVDSDDTFKENSFKSLYEFADERDLDIVVFDFIKEYKNKKVREYSMKDNSSSSYILSTPNACNKMYRLSIFKENDILFKKGIWYEDLALIPGLIRYTNKIGYYNQGLYNYYMRDNSIMRQKIFNSKFLDILDVIVNLGDYIKDSYPMELEYLAILHAFYGSSLKIMEYNELDSLHQCRTFMTSNFPNWRENRYFKKRDPIFRLYCYMLYYKRYRLCRVLIKLKERLKDE